MPNICIKVEFLCGTSIGEAVEEAKQLAIKLDIAYVKFEFNGVSMSIGQRANVIKGVDKFHKALMTKEYKFVIENGK